ncbi:T-cell-specific surface glycoprotein CD28 [Centrocercus urophasianus]|nr:T-cell-specific surface glycoprotein CD28 [Centrocercus urophasianus]XP_042678111.1 T-cell-specific surface glycoprotein CD28 [Centrocercus urophasianus]
MEQQTHVILQQGGGEKLCELVMVQIALCGRPWREALGNLAVPGGWGQGHRPTIVTMLGILVVLCLIPAADVTENKILVAQSPLLIVANRTATLVCNYTYNGTGKEFRASLHKGTDSSVEVCFISWNMTKSNSNSNKEFNCWGNHDKDKVIFNLRNMTASQTDIYFCKIEAMYPPPYVYNEKSNGTVIHVRETPIQTQEPESATSYWVMVAVTGLLGFYSMLITAVFIIYRQKSKRNRYRQSDYMNMTPRHPPHQKNKGYPSYAPTRDYTAYRSWQP